MKFEVTILGCGSATPTLRHGPTSQLLEHDSHYFLIDCGEGTQLQLRRFKIRFLKINHIFISHNHGDHCLGLPGLISTLHLLGRTRPLDVYAQEGLKEAVEQQLKISHSRLRFEVNWHNLNPNQKTLIFENKKLEIFSFPLNHRVPCCGFLFAEKAKARNIKPEYISKYNIPVARIRQIKAGSDYKLEDGTEISNDELTYSPESPLSYAFCSDTAYQKQTSGYVKGVDLLYHESTFLEEDAERAQFTFHSTASQAARVAKEASAGKLLLGHYSARYRDMEPFRAEAMDVFSSVELADEGLIVPVKNVEKNSQS
ncbi:ribonuclease Z [Cryomorphaceae bacterium 1068]|nr:ribonuclease Z [Cryomorphaceae bacterium 1068]